jgi:ABC-type transporter Mla subunit MlaD
MSRPLRWSQLVPGLVATILIVVAIATVLTRARLGATHGHTQRFYATFPSARDVLKGTEVWLDGQKVGLVNGVQFRSAATDTTVRLIASLDILDDPVKRIRRDSRADVRPGGTLIGAPVVYISSGTLRAPALAKGDTIEGLPGSEVDVLATASRLASKEVPALLADVRQLTANVHAPRGSIGPLLDGSTMRQVTRALDGTSRLADRVTSAGGSAGVAARREELRASVLHVTHAIDSVRQLVSDRGTGLGRFRRDSTLTTTLADLRSELAQASRMFSGAGSLGRLGSDSALTQQLTRLDGEIAALMADIKRRPFRYLAF